MGNVIFWSKDYSKIRFPLSMVCEQKFRAALTQFCSINGVYIDMLMRLPKFPFTYHIYPPISPSRESITTGRHEK